MKQYFFLNAKWSLMGALLCILGTSMSFAQDTLVFSDLKKVEEVSSIHEEIFPLSFGEKQLLFTRIYRPEAGQQTIKYGTWCLDVETGAEQQLHLLEEGGKEAIVGVTDSLLYVKQVYQGEIHLFSLSKAVLEGGESKAIEVEIPGLKDISSLSVCATGDIMLIVMSSGRRKEQDDLFVSFKKGLSAGKEHWTRPKSLGRTINSMAYELSPFLQRDTKTLFFSSEREGGKGGADIYRTERLDDTWQQWAEPINLSEINTEHFDAYFVWEDSLAYWASNRDTAAAALSDIYRAEGRWNKVELAKDIVDRQAGIVPDTTASLYANRKLPLSTAESPAEKGLFLLDASTSVKEYAIEFGVGSADLYWKDIALLNKLSQVLIQNRNYMIKLQGHADAVGSSDDNLILSRQRAEAIRHYLLEKGVSFAQVKVQYHGEKEPLTSNNTKEGRQQNRRVEIYLSKIDIEQ
ncbi:OmpA family protein [Algivirga pacifica]|uniref:OmpA-like domain-containing protein n=1 Tax=Algivirga pacifica TaxID=1162670 RepID=A0ABP9DM65_9BACT